MKEEQRERNRKDSDTALPRKKMKKIVLQFRN